MISSGVRIVKKKWLISALMLSVALVSGCEGDSRPFEEAVEVQTLGLEGISVVPIGNALDDIFLNTGQTLQMGINATNDDNPGMFVSASDRDWRSSQPSIVSVNRDGLIVAGVEGEAEISVSLGGLESEPFTVTVSNATVTSIAGINGPESLERCLPSDYFAVGLFSDGTTRALDSASFSLLENSTGELLAGENGATRVNARTFDVLVLTAAQDDLAPLSRELTVRDTLRSLEITPAIAIVEAGQALDFTATGTYNSVGGEGDSRSENITPFVEWAITTGAQFVSVSNNTGSEGRLSGRVAGVATLQARCGTDVLADRTVTVQEDDDSDSTVLSFDVPNGGDTITVALGQTVNLRVSRGSDFDSTEVISSGVVYTFSNTGNTATPINEGLLEQGVISPLVTGGTGTITATVPESDGLPEATGTINFRVGNS